MSESSSVPICPQCGQPLPMPAPAGLCPRCLLAMNLFSETRLGGEAVGAPAAPLPPEALAPHFPQLEILECLGRGGMGVVYKARQKSLNRLVALKLLAPERVLDASFAERFAREARALAALNHPNIVTVHDFGQAGGFYFLIMEFVDGANLRQLLQARKFSPEEALAIVPPLCEALQYAHERGIVHRDIKPENLLLDKSGRIKIADFGIARMLGSGSEVAGDGTAPAVAASPDFTRLAGGTPGYMAPEQKSAPQRVDARADIYSLGVVFYEMLTGEMPGRPIEPPSRKVKLDVRLDEIVLRALEQVPELRYQQASELKTMVDTIASTPPPAKAPVGQSPDTRTLAARFSRTAIVGACCAALSFVISGSIMIFAGLNSTSAMPAALWEQALSSLLLTLGVAVPFGTTVLGWIAVVRIRRSAVRLGGLGLALFDGLLFPLLAIDALIAFVCRKVHVAFALRNFGTPAFDAHRLQRQNVIVMLGLLLIVALLDFLIVRAAWRVVKKPAGIRAKVSPAGCPPGPKAMEPAARKTMRPALLTVGWHAVVLLVALYSVVVAARFGMIYSDFGLALPLLSSLTLKMSHVLSHIGVVLLPMLLALDAGLCLLAQYVAGRWLRHVWSAVFVAACGVIFLVPVLSVCRSVWSMQGLTESLGSPSVEANPAIVPTSGQASPRKSEVQPHYHSIDSLSGEDVKSLHEKTRGQVAALLGPPTKKTENKDCEDWEYVGERQDLGLTFGAEVGTNMSVVEYHFGANPEWKAKAIAEHGARSAFAAIVVDGDEAAVAAVVAFATSPDCKAQVIAAAGAKEVDSGVLRVRRDSRYSSVSVLDFDARDGETARKVVESMVNILKTRFAGTDGPAIRVTVPPELMSQRWQAEQPYSKRQRFAPKEGLAGKTSWGVMDHSEFNPNGWAVLAHMSLGGEAWVRLPGETQDVCRIKLTEGNDEEIKLDVEDLTRTNRMRVALLRNGITEITVNGSVYRVRYPAVTVATNEPDTTPFALVTLTHVELCAFGPVLERDLRYFRDGRSYDVVWLADGLMSSLPDNFFNGSEAGNREWLSRHGPGVFSGVHGLQWGLGGALVCFADVPSDWWERPVSLDELTRAVGSSQSGLTRYKTQGGTIYLLPENVQLPATLAFQDFRGICGLLQVTAIHDLATTKPDEPLGLTIRFKVAQAPGLPVISAPATQQPAMPAARLQFRLVAEEHDTTYWEWLADPDDRTGQRPLPVRAEALLDAGCVASATVTNSPVGNPQIVVTFNNSGAKQFAAITAANVGRKMAIVFDGRVLSAPVIRTPITGGVAVIEGRLTRSEAEAIAAVLNKP